MKALLFLLAVSASAGDRPRPPKAPPGFVTPGGGSSRDCPELQRYESKLKDIRGRQRELLKSVSDGEMDRDGAREQLVALVTAERAIVDDARYKAEVLLCAATPRL